MYVCNNLCNPHIGYIVLISAEMTFWHCMLHIDMYTCNLGKA